MDIKRLLDMRNKTQKDLTDATNVSSSTINNYKNGKSDPTLSNIVKIAKFLNVSIETLIGIENNTIDLNMLNKNKADLINSILNLNPNDTDKVLSFIAGLNAGNKED